MPSGATWESGSTLIEVTFDQPLEDGALDAGNWSFAPPGPAVINGASVAGGVVQLQLSAAPLSVSTVSFAPPPFDVVAAGSGLSAAAFSGFPVVTT